MNCRCPFGSGLRVAHCAKCHETFTTPAGFDLHQSFVRGAGVICHNPATMKREDGSPVFIRVGDAWARYTKPAVLAPGA